VCLMFCSSYHPVLIEIGNKIWKKATCQSPVASIPTIDEVQWEWEQASTPLHLRKNTNAHHLPPFPHLKDEGRETQKDHIPRITNPRLRMLGQQNGSTL
jgi:hypothetical protein